MELYLFFKQIASSFSTFASFELSKVSLSNVDSVGPVMSKRDRNLREKRRLSSRLTRTILIPTKCAAQAWSAESLLFFFFFKCCITKSQKGLQRFLIATLFIAFRVKSEHSHLFSVHFKPAAKPRPKPRKRHCALTLSYKSDCFSPSTGFPRVVISTTHTHTHTVC